MKIITLDFETYYAKDFSLSKLTTEEYIRDPRFEVIGVAVKENGGAARWCSGTKAQIKKFLDTFDWANSAAVAHNAMFDMAVLNWHFDIRPRKIADTLSMARAIDGPDAGNSLAKLAERYGIGVKGTEVVNAMGKRSADFTPGEMRVYGEYCINDVELTYQLFGIFAPVLPKFEMNLIDLTVRMFSEPVLELDTCVLEDHLLSVKEKKEMLLDAARVGDRSVLMSNPQFADLLLKFGATPPTKVSPTTGKETWAFSKSDEGFKALLEYPHPAVQALVAARLGVKSTLEETRTERFIQIASRGTLPVPLRYYAAHTGRFGGDDKINLQNLPRKSALKRAIRAPEGYRFVDCDSSQIEARVLAWLAGQDDLVAAFANGEDVYKIMAAEIYNKGIDQITDSERFVGKTTILGAGYNMGAKRFQAQLKTFGAELPLDMCEYIIAVYRQTYPKIPELWQNGNRLLTALMQQNTCAFGHHDVVRATLLGIELPNGLHIRYPNLRVQPSTTGQNRDETVYDTRKGRTAIATRIYGGKVTENVCQALARIVIGEQMLMIARRYKVVMTVHDAVGALVPEDGAAEGRQFIETCMRIRPKWATTLPLNCESKIGSSYGG